MVHHTLPGITQLHTDLAGRIRDGSFEVLMLLDIDQVHQLNEETGHETGDRELALVEQVVMEGSWDGYRIGGDQFALIGPKAQINEAEIRSALTLLSEKSVGVRVTFSAGGVRDLGDVVGDTPETVAETIRLAAAAGLVGGSIEDATGNPNDPL